jgi:DNA repair exonuclease SbcCD nuclease subunit
MASSPRNRLDHLPTTQSYKVDEILGLMAEHHCCTVLSAGDFTDRPDLSNAVLSSYIRKFRAAQKDNCPVVYTVLGQHDLYMRSQASINRIATNVMDAAGVIQVVSGNDVHWLEPDRVSVQGAGIGEPIPEPEASSEFRILLAHRMVGDSPLWPGQELTRPKEFLRRNPGYDLIVLGDYHYRFLVQDGGQTLCNAGALVRKSVALRDVKHTPGVFLFDTETREIELIELKSAPPADAVLNLSEQGASAREGPSESLVEFVNRLRTKQEIGTRFKGVLLMLCDERSAPEAVRDLLSEVMEQVGFDE